MNDFLAGILGLSIGSSLARTSTCSHSHHDHSTLERLQRESNELKRKEMELKDEELYLSKVKQFVDSIDINCDRDSLEILIYDEVEESSYMRMFYEGCELQNKITPFDGRWSQERFAGFYTFLKNKNPKSSDDEMMIKAYEKFELRTRKHFGKLLGQTTDRYDYFMYLKQGPSYEAKYITQDELLEILGSNKYGYSKHLMSV